MLTEIEFTEHQRNVFCVFSGKGVNDLRTYLNQQNYAMGEDYGPQVVDDGDDDHTMTGMMGSATLNAEDDADVDGDGDEELDADDGPQTWSLMLVPMLIPKTITP